MTRFIISNLQMNYVSGPFSIQKNNFENEKRATHLCVPLPCCRSHSQTRSTVLPASAASAFTSSHSLTSSLTLSTAHASPAACSRVPTVLNPILSGSESSYTSERIRCSEICGLPDALNNSILGVGRPANSCNLVVLFSVCCTEGCKNGATDCNALLWSTTGRRRGWAINRAREYHLLLMNYVICRVFRVVLDYWD